MAKPRLTEDTPIESRLFHLDGKGLRGITMINSTKGKRILVTALNKDGTRRQLTTYTLPNKDFSTQWQRAVESLRAHYGIEVDSDLHRRMINASDAFLTRYSLSLQPPVIVLQVAA